MLASDTDRSPSYFELLAKSPFLNELRPLLPAYAGIFGLSFFFPFLYFVSPIFVSQVMERVLLSRSEMTLLLLASIAFMMIAIHMVLDYMRSKALQRLGAVIDAQMGRPMFDATFRSGGNAQTLVDFNIVRETLSGASVSTIFDAVFSPIFVLVMFMIHWVYGLISLFLLLLTVLLAVLNYRLTKTDAERQAQLQSKELEFSLAISRNADAVRALGMLPRVANRWHGLHTKMLGWQSSARASTDFIASISKFIRYSQMILVYAIGAVLIIHQQVSPGAVFMIMIIKMRALAPLDALISNWKSYSMFALALRRIDEVLAQRVNEPDKISLPSLTGPLVVSRVFVSAPNQDRAILNDVSFTVQQGRTVGVIGPSGSGKSTLGRVLAGIWRPRRGTVSVGDHDLTHWNEDELGRHMGYMPQDVELLPGTIADNISRFDPAAVSDPAPILAAAELAGIQDLIRSLPDGYNTRVGPGEYVLSGGQRNRIALARAVYGSPSLIVLDEPNSNLDAPSEQSLLAMVQRLQADSATVIVITHKLNILNYCDDVLVLNSGAVQAFGSRDQIVDRIPRLRSQPNLAVIEGRVEGRRSSDG
jgi:PrtD family type I secretion system ABC transporter